MRRVNLTIEQSYRANNLINRMKQRAGLVLAVICLTSGLALTGFCLNQPVSSQSAIAPAANSAGSNTGQLNAARYSHTATLLPNGNVLVTGGYSRKESGTVILNSAEVYDANTGTWSITGNLNLGRVGHTATLLTNGKLLVVGGNTSIIPPSFGVTNSAELFDPATGMWSTTGSLNTNHTDHTATLLPNGKVLVTAGWDGSEPVKSAELYDPDTGTWTITGSLITARYWHTASLLQNGKVLVAAGSDEGDLFTALASAELYDPDTGTWSKTASLSDPRVLHSATLLQNGKVLVAGGYGGYVYGQSDSEELYDSTTGEWSHTGNVNTIRYGHTSTLLPNGNVLVSGGGYSSPGGPVNFTNSAELYDPATATWYSTDELKTARYGHTATLLSDGKVLLAGGSNGSGALNSAELYDAAAGTIAIPKIVGASVAGKKLFILGEKFQLGAVILLNGEDQRTTNDDQNPKTTLICKKAGKKVKPGDKLQVRNPNGTLSQEFTFTGS